MSTSRDVVAIVNALLYIGNKYNLYGTIAFYTTAVCIGMLHPPLSSSSSGPSWGFLRSLMIIILFFTVAVSTKTLLHTFFSFTDVCECDSSSTAYNHHHLKTCPSDKDVKGVFRDIRILLRDTVFEWGYRYNVLVPVIVMLLGGLLQLFTIS